MRRITRKRSILRVQNPVRDTGELARIQSRLRGQGAAPSMAAIAEVASDTLRKAEAIIHRMRLVVVWIIRHTRYRSYNELGFVD